MIEFLLTLYKLKEKIRKGWKLHGIENPEDVADHSFGTAFLTLLLTNEKYDVGKCLSLALVHDIHEAISGDLPYSKIETEKKQKKEEKAFEELISNLDRKRGELQALWYEYFHKKTDEAQFVRDMDKLDMVLQALFYTKKHVEEEKNIEPLNLDEFFESAKRRIATPIGKRFFRVIQREYQKLKERGKKGKME